MFNALASLAERRGKLVVAVAVVFFALAGALGSSVADRLDPYGADDPDTEAIQADDRLEAAGFRDASVILLLSETDPTTPAGAKRVNEIQRRVRAAGDVAAVVSTGGRADATLGFTGDRPRLLEAVERFAG